MRQISGLCISDKLPHRGISVSSVSKLEKVEQTKKEVKIEKKKTEEKKAKEIRRRALEILNPRKYENVVDM